MNDEIQLVSDGDGIAVIGAPEAVELFLTTEGLEARALDLSRAWSSAGSAGAVVQMASEMAANSSRWVKLTKESAGLAKKYGLMKSSVTGLDMGVIQVKGQAGIKGILQFSKGPGAALTNPAVLAGVGGILSQVAMQQQMQEMTKYLAVIDEKIDDLIRADRDAVLSELDGVGLILDEATAIRSAVGRVSETTWSKIQSSSGSIATVQARALRELDAIAAKVERASALGDKAEAASIAASRAPQWLAVIARTFQLQDELAVIELDRVLDGSPEDLDQHLLGLRAARERRVGTISTSTVRVLERMSAAGAFANDRALTHPMRSRDVVESSNQVAADVIELHSRLGITDGHEALEAVRWRDAVAEVGERAWTTGTQGVDAVRRVSVDAAGRTGDLTQRARGAMGDATSTAKDKASNAAARLAGIRIRRQRDESE